MKIINDINNQLYLSILLVLEIIMCAALAYICARCEAMCLASYSLLGLLYVLICATLSIFAMFKDDKRRIKKHKNPPWVSDDDENNY